MTYHDDNLFFVIYLAYVNLAIFNPEYADLVTRLLDYNILKNVFLRQKSHIPRTFPKKLKIVLTHLFKIKTHIGDDHA